MEIDILELAKRDAAAALMGDKSEMQPICEGAPESTINSRAYAIILDAHNRAEALYALCSDPYRRKSARAWLCSPQSNQAEEALNKQFYRAVAAAARGKEGNADRGDAMRKLAEGTHWWLTQITGKLGVRV